MAQERFLHKAETRLENENPLVSVIVPAYNEEEVVEACIQSLKEQTYENIEVIFVDDELENVFEGLDDSDPIKKALIRAIENIREDARAGRVVKKKLIPRELIQKYGINNLRIYNLPSAWRMFYTVTAGDIEIISVVLDWMSHKDYERLFGF